MMQPPRRRQVEAGGVAADLEEHRRKTVSRAASSAIHSASVSFSRLRDQQARGIDPVKETHPGA